MLTGAPVLADALAAFDCLVEEIVERHSHAIVLGAVVGSRFANTPFRLIVSYLGAAFGSFAVSLSIATLFVLIVTFLPQGVVGRLRGRR